MPKKKSPLAKELLQKTRAMCSYSLRTGDFTSLTELVEILTEVMQMMQQTTLKYGATAPAKKATRAKGRA